MTTMGLMAGADAQILVRGTFLEIREEEEPRAPVLATFPMMASGKWCNEAESEGSTTEDESMDEYNRRLADEIKALEASPAEVVTEASKGAGQSEDFTAAVPAPPGAGEQVDVDDSAETRTTLMMKNLPCGLHTDALLELLNREGFSGQYDLVYLPIDFKTGFSLGYCFVNFVSSACAQQFFAKFDGFSAWGMPTRKVARLFWSEQQGLAANVEKYRNSNVMHEDVPDHFKPLLFLNGELARFPPPTRALQPPCRTVRPESDETRASASPPRQLAGACQTGELATSCYTTVMLRNVPNDYNRSMLENLLNSQGFFGHYDFLYLPQDFERRCNLGYSFVNLVSHASAQMFFARFSGFRAWGIATRKVAEVEWAKPRCQGFEAHVDRYRGRPIMQSGVPDECKPAIYFHGVRIAFPAGGSKQARSNLS